MNLEHSIYRLPVGELREEHCAALGEALAGVLSAGAKIAITLDDAPAAELAVLGALRGHVSAEACVLQYASLAALRDKLHALFTNADPELFFAHADPFERVIERVARADRDSRPAQRKARIDSLRAAYAPLVLRTADERFVVLQAEAGA